ncbi:hypothetical protein [Bradyrhizobium valentinum]|uniref:hypothetical protein n=1 Tax=Bradyrhizobium valentinum TaxID=1518501 RepID=UPI000B1E5566|nr:hypothetical protein [Bradyrhizobium valentinum]
MRQFIGLSEIAYQYVHGVAIAGEGRLAITDYFRPAEIVDVLARIRAGYPRLRLEVSMRKSALIEEYTGYFDIGISRRLLDGRRQGHLERAGRILIDREPFGSRTNPCRAEYGKAAAGGPA